MKPFPFKKGFRKWTVIGLCFMILSIFLGSVFKDKQLTGVVTDAMFYGVLLSLVGFFVERIRSEYHR